MPGTGGLERAIDHYRAALLAEDAAARRELLAAYRVARRALRRRLNALAPLLAENPTTDRLLRDERYRLLVGQVEAEMRRLAVKAEGTVRAGQAATVELAGAREAALVGTTHPAILGNFAALPKEAVADLVGTLSDGSPLRSLLAEIAPDVGEGASRALIEGVTLGLGPREVARAIAEATDAGAVRALRIGRTAMLDASRSASLRTYAANAQLLRGWAWVSAKDARTCLACLALDGEVFGLDVRFFPRHVACFAAGTMASRRGVVGSIVRHYVGPIVEVETVGGRRLSVTPNHPILTPEGWVAAGSLNEGHHLVCRPLRQSGRGAAEPHDDDVPAPIEEVAESFGGTGRVVTRAVPSSAEDLYGDGMGSDVYVVRSGGLLGHDLDAAFGHHGRKDSLGGGRVGLPMLAGDRGPVEDIGRSLLAANRVVSGLHVAPVLFRRSLGRHEAIGLQGPTDCDVRHCQASSDDRSRDAEGIGQGLLGLARYVATDRLFGADHALGAGARRCFFATDSQAFGGGSIQTAIHEDALQPIGAQPPNPLADGLHAISGDVILDRVLKVGIRAFEGHVYNLETENGWYEANEIVAHNCRCGPRPVLLDRFGPMPEMESGAEWFARQPAAVRAAMVPKALRAEVEAGAVVLDDFVSETFHPRWGAGYRESTVAGARANAARRMPTPRPAARRRAEAERDRGAEGGGRGERARARLVGVQEDVLAPLPRLRFSRIGIGSRWSGLPEIRT